MSWTLWVTTSPLNYAPQTQLENSRLIFERY
uniref:Uncharacterized protein n=1 Tax=Rhizophora mucronata TaxID=61149 RepID=A0A2P2PEN3_RHIMU